jgi:HSP20 family protein
MPEQQNETADAASPEITDIDSPESDSSAIATATFAVYKNTKKLGIPTIGNSEKQKAVPQKRMITEIGQLDEDQENADAPESGKPVKKSTKKTMPKKITQTADNEWLNGEGQLVVDMYQTESDLVIQSAIAGIKVEDLDVVIEDDLVTIKGNRANPLQENGDYFLEECYWGTFSRKLILPVEVDSSRADAAMKDGILTIRIPKINREKKKKIFVKD